MIVEEKMAGEFNCHYPDATRCAGSRCMAWRWEKEEKALREGDPLGRDYFYEVSSTTHGYCGLAGRP